MRAIVFDLDGTLIDSAPDLMTAGNRALAAEGLGLMTLAQARSFIGNGAAVFVERMLAMAGVPADPVRQARMLAAFLDLYESAVFETVLYPGVTGALDALGDAGWRIGLCTNKPLIPTRSVLSHFGLLDRFAAIVGGDSLPERKPHPAPLHAAVAALGGGQALYVGDSEVDAECARRAALAFALYTEGYRKAPVADLTHDATFSHFSDLPALADRMLKDRT